jgi:hypothetical protein
MSVKTIKPRVAEAIILNGYAKGEVISPKITTIHTIPVMYHFNLGHGICYNLSAKLKESAFNLQM